MSVRCPAGYSAKEIADVLANHGLRPTQQRIAVYDYLLRHPVHPTAETIYQAVLERYPSFSRTTIYNCLHALVNAGLIRAVTIEAEEQRFDGNAADHAHFKCTACGAIYDFEMERGRLRGICPPAFQVQVQDLYFKGICPACSQKSAP